MSGRGRSLSLTQTVDLQGLLRLISGVSSARDLDRVQILLDAPTMKISLRDATSIDAAVCAWIAAFIRERSLRRFETIVVLPKSSTSSALITKQLAGYQFVEALANLRESQCIVILHELSNVESSNFPQRRRHYLPIFFFDVSTFEVDHPDIWLATPSLTDSLRTFFATHLRAHGLVHESNIIRFEESLVLETLWNTVLHSFEGIGAGSGAACACVTTATDLSRSDAILSFGCADVGRGIGEVLGPSYRASDVLRVNHGISAVVRYALEKDSTSRPRLPINRRAWGNRGLYELASTLRDRSAIQVMSSGVLFEMITTQGGSHDWFLKRDASAQVARSTIISAELRAPSKIERLVLLRDALGHKLDTAPILLLPNFAHSGEAILQLKDQLRSRVAPKQDLVLLVDCGAQNLVGANLDAIARCVQATSPQLAPWFVNCETSSGDLEQLADYCVRNMSSAVPAVAIDSSGNIAIFAEVNDQARLEAAAAALGVEVFEIDNAGIRSPSIAVKRKLPKTALLRIQHRANTAFVADGFSRAREEEGFYAEPVELLSGGISERFFSLSVNVANSTSALSRWSFSLACALDLVVRRSAATQQLQVIAFSAISRKLLHESLRILDNAQLRSATLFRAYEAPSKTELAPVVRPDHGVILVCDVVVSGRQLEAFRSLMSRLAVTVVGEIVVSDSRQEMERGTNVLSLSHIGISCLKPPIWCRLAVDEVSLRPVPKTAAGSDLRSRIEESLRILSEAECLVGGHIVDGDRHSSVYVDIERLVDRHRDTLLAILRRQIDAALGSRRWIEGPNTKIFDPLVAMRPIGTERIETINIDGLGSPARHLRAVDSVIQLVREAKAWRFRVSDVERRFDENGQPHCEQNTDGPKQIPPIDVIIVDDCIASGLTAKKLIQIAARSGARRILYVALLSRQSLSEVAWWEAERNRLGEDFGIEIQVVFPLLLPIPFDSRETCPLEFARHSIRNHRERSADSIAISNVLIDDEPITTDVEDVPRSAERLSLRDIRIRVFSELSSQDARFLGELTTVVTAAKNEGDFTALARIFWSDARLLARPRLHEVIAPIVEVAATAAIQNATVSVKDRKAALSILRSTFVTRFAESIVAFVEACGVDVELAKRLAFHIYSLDDSLRNTIHVQRAATMLAEKSLGRMDERTLGENDGLEGWRCAYSLSRQSLSGSRFLPVSLSDERVDLKNLEAALASPRVHLADQYLGSYVKWRGIRAALSEDTVKGAGPDWAMVRDFLHEDVRQALTNCGPFFTRLLSYLRSPIGIPGSTLVGISEDELSYFVGAADSGGSLFGNLTTVDFCLQSTDFGATKRQMIAKMIYDPALLLSSRVFKKETSSVAKLVRGLQSVDVSNLCDQLRRRVAATCPSLRDDQIVVQVAPLLAESARLFVDPFLVRLASDAIASNLGTKSFDDNGWNDALVTIDVEQNEISTIDVYIDHNGRRSHGAQSQNTLEIEAGLRIFSAAIRWAHAEGDPQSTLSFKLWS